MPLDFFKSKSGKRYIIHSPRPKSDVATGYVFSFAKSGSTLLENMLSEYCKVLKIPRLSIFDMAFRQGVATHDIGADSKALLEESGRIYTGFRHFPTFELNVENKNAILLVRDPRDMLVSLYYSIAKSHKVPDGLKGLKNQRQVAQQHSIDEDVVSRAQSYLNQHNHYVKALASSNLKLFRYEDVIYQKESWLEEVLKHMQLPVDSQLVQVVAKKFDIIPSAEQESAHIRQVHPGNYKSKLSSETIEKLDQKLAPFLEYYRYE